MQTQTFKIVDINGVMVFDNEDDTFTVFIEYTTKDTPPVNGAHTLEFTDQETANNVAEIIELSDQYIL